MRYRYNSTAGYKAGVGAIIGTFAGGIGATVATVWGGYELGSVINDALYLTNTVGRGALDLVVMSVVAGPTYSIGVYGGMAAGGAIGAISHPVIEEVRYLGILISKGYQRIRGDKNDKSQDRDICDR